MEDGIARRTLLKSVGAGALLAAVPAGRAAATPRRSGYVDPATPRHARPYGVKSPHSTLVFSDEFTGASVDTAK